MSDVLRILLEVTVYSVILYAVIMLFKKAFRKRMSAVLNYAVWALLLLRLLLPVTIDSGLSLFVIPETNTPIAQEQALVDTQPPGSSKPTSQIASSQISSVYQQPANNYVRKEDEAALQAPRWNFDWQVVIALLWALGVFVFGAYMLRLWLKLQRRINGGGLNLPEDIKNLTQSIKLQMGIKASIEVFAYEWLTTPALSASIRPKLLLNANMLQNSEQLMFGIRHELTHFKHKDYLISLLLVMLRCVYWFNPVVWLAAKQIETDMETVCDASVTASMKNVQRGRYIETMIDLSQNVDTQYMLGMGTRADRKSIEKRIRGMFMIKRTTPAARTAAALMACLMLIVCFTTACQPTPETAPVVNKGDNHLEEMIASSAASPIPAVTVDPEQSNQEQEEVLRQALMDRLNAPETYEDSFTNDKGDVTVSFDDAQVEVPSVQSIPAVKVSTCAFSQETVNKIAAYFFKDAQLYVKDDTMTKDELESLIVEVRGSLKGVSNGAYEGNQKYLEDLEKQYETAPEEKEKVPTTTELTKNKYGMGLRVMADIGKGEMAEFSVYNDDDRNTLCFMITNGKYHSPFYGKQQGDFAESMSTTREQAQAMVEQCLRDIGLDDMRIDSVAVEAYQSQQNNETGKEKNDQINQQCYVFNVQRVVKGVGVSRVTSSVQMDTDDPNVTQNEPVYSEAAPAECMEIVVDDTGIVYFSWSDPSEEEEILSESVTLMPFNEIVQKAKDNMFFKNYTAYGSECHIHITSIELGMMRVMKKDAPGEYMMIPVWDFIGNHEHIMDGESHWLPFGDQSYVTINAIDGSSINRDGGY